MATIKDLKFDDKNFNKHTEFGMSLLEKSLRENGAGRSILLDKDNNIIAGNGIVEAAGSVGLEKVKIVEATGDEIIAVKRTDISLNSHKGREMALADNATAAVDLDWDDEAIKSEFTEEEANGWGVDLDWKDVEEVEEDEAPEVNENEPADSELGKVYQLGEHRLMCGDSTDAGIVAILMDGQKADMVFTDPPYGMKKEAEGVLNDNLNYDKLLDFNKKWIPLTFDNLKDNGSWYCWGIDEPLMDIYSNILKPMAKENKISIQNYITWDKGIGLGQMSNLQRSYSIATEKCWFVICGVQWYNDNSDNYFEGFEPIRSYLDAECEKCGGHKIWKQMLGNNMGSHYFTKSQWCFPTKEAYEKMQAFGKEYGAFGKEYEEIKKQYEVIKKQYEEIKKGWYDTRAYFDNTHDNMNDVWHFNRTSESERKHTGGHATPKPLALCQRAIKSSSRENESVLDLFGGSGSTLIACEQLGRKCYMMELDPKYCDVIRKRYWKFKTGSEEGWQDGTKATN
jgi:DNA modification methylase